MASARGKRIEAARKRVDARRAALGNYADRRRDDIRDQARATYGRNLGRTKFGKTDTGSKRRGFWGDLKQMGSDLSNIGPMRDAKTMVKDVIVNPAKEGIGRFMDYFPEAKEKWKIPSSLMLLDSIAQGREETKAAERDYGKTWLQGGNPIAADQYSPVHQYLLNLPGMDKRNLNRAIRDDDLHWADLQNLLGADNREGSAGYIALLNDPSRLKKYTPIAGLNYLRSITGDPSNLGWGAFEQMREGDFEGLSLPVGAEEGDYSGLTSTAIAQKLLPYYQAKADEMYGQGFIGDTAATNYGSPHMDPTVAVDDEIMNYRDPIRDRVAQTGTGQSTIPYQNAEDVLINEVPSNISAINYGEPNLVDDDILYGEPGNQPLNTILQGIYPNYTPNPILNELEDMDEQALLDWGAQNPIAAKSLGFNPYYSNMWLD